MATEREKQMQALGHGIDDILRGMTGKKYGFILVTFDFETQTYADYIANGKRADVVKALRECADTLEANLDMPTTEGSA